MNFNGRWVNYTSLNKSFEELYKKLEDTGIAEKIYWLHPVSKYSDLPNTYDCEEGACCIVIEELTIYMKKNDKFEPLSTVEEATEEEIYEIFR